MSGHKEKLRNIRLIRAQQARENDLFHRWLQNEASEADIAILSEESEIAQRPLVHDLDVSPEEKERIQEQEREIVGRASEVKQRLFKWMALEGRKRA